MYVYAKSPVPQSIAVKILKEYTGHTGSVFAMALSHDAKTLFTSGDDGIVAAWDLEKDQEQGMAILRVDNSIYCLLAIPGTNLLAAGAADGTVHIVDLAQNKVVHQYARSRDSIYNLFYHAGSQSLLTLHGGGFLSVMDIHSFEERAYRRLASEHLRSIVQDPQSKRIFIGTSDNQILCLNDQDLGVEHHFEAHENSVFSLMVHPDARYLFSGSRDAQFRIWDLNDPQYPLRTHVPAHMYTINDVKLSPSGDHFITASRDKTLKVWDAYNFSLLKVIDFERHQGHKHSVNKLVWIKSDNSVISCSDDRRVIRWQLGFS